VGVAASAKSRRWSLNVLFSTADQGLFSGANFLGAILLAKSVSPEEYGAYSVGFAIYLLFTSFYTSLVLEPVSVLGWNLSSALGTVKYLYRLGLFHLALTLPLLAGVVISSFFAGRLRPVLLMMATALPFALLIWGIRRVAYVYTKPLAACVCSGVYCISLLGAMQLLRGRGYLSAPSFFGCMAFAAIVAAVPGLTVALRHAPDQPALPPTSPLPEPSLFRQHWSFGKWLVISSFMTTVSAQAQFLISAAFLDLKSAGVLRAMMNFTLPPLQVIQAVSILALPPMSRKFDSGDHRDFLRMGHIVTLGLTGGTVLFEVILFLFRSSLSSIAYGNKYPGYSLLIPVLGLLAVMQALASYSLVMRAMRRPQATLYIAGASLICVLVLTAPATKFFGVYGTAVSTIVSYAAAASVSYYLAKRYVAAELSIARPSAAKLAIASPE
jgi:O-antigen/teichoic acid export membrane protein